ncbi:MAG: MBL fold metallo-hydrolase [Thermoproteota archaeon]|nr:MBL fold metallo-hydrolase [Thermoproteota archaeon]
MIVKRWVVGSYFTNCYVVRCAETKEAILIDPGFSNNTEAEKILREAEEKGLRTKYVVNTHGHPDHTSGNHFMKKKTGAPILIHEYDAPMLTKAGKGSTGLFGVEARSPPADKLLHDEDVVKFGNIALKVLHTPGHSRGSISLLGENAVFTGDTLFAGSIGRTDFPGASYKQLMRSIKERLATLPDHFIVYPGHGPVSTIKEEKKSNPFLQPSTPMFTR